MQKIGGLPAVDTWLTRYYRNSYMQNTVSEWYH